MAYLKKIKSFIGAKKVLRLLATKLRLHKLQTTKTTRRKIKKRTTTKGGGGSCFSLSFQPRFKRKRKEVHRYPWKKAKPVYVDQLFLEKKEVGVGIPVVERILSGNTVEGTSGKSGGCVADEMWESLVMGPEMDGINERAEEFISRFRADHLVDQEITARRL